MTDKKKLKLLTYSTIILAITAITSVSYIIRNRTLRLDHRQAVDTVAAADVRIDAALEQHWDSNRRVPPDRGRFIPIHEAVINAHEYRRQRNDEPLLRKEPYGFAIGRLKLQRLLDNIVEWNTKLDTANQITAVRIYLVRNVTRLASGDKQHFDVMLLPVTADGYNLVPIGDVADGRRILEELARKGLSTDEVFLNTSSPCPDMCDDPTR